MSPVGRYIVLALFIIIGLHLVLSITHQEYGRATSLKNLGFGFGGHKKESNVPTDYYLPPNSNVTNIPLQSRRANATLVMLARNSDLDDAVRSVREAEDRFNRKFKYPWVFLNEEPFSNEFKRRISILTKAKIFWEQIPADDWYQPKWIDEDKAAVGRKKLEDEGIIYGGSVSYRNMCRFNSRTFYNHKRMQDFRWYWRVEPDVHFHCDVDFDPFLFMEDHKKVYGWTITMYEFRATIESLWSTTKEFIKAHPEYLAPNNAMGFISDDNGNEYNLCHWWSNFEIADMDFWRAPAYSEYVDYLEASGGFYYERWGDAPVHSIGAALFASRDQLHFFDEIGYEHNPYQHCPKSVKNWNAGRCACNQEHSFDYDGYSCMRKWDAFMET